MIDDAMDFAAKAHAGQFRKGTRRPYIVHPIEVADIVSSMTKDEEVICAAVLHDTVEDCKGITFDILKLRFGARVADMVAQESEDKTSCPICAISTGITRWRGMISGSVSGCRANRRLHGIIKGYATC